MNFTSHFTCQNFLLELIGCVIELIPNGRINEIMDGGRSGWLVAAVNGDVGRGIDGPCQMHGMKPNLLLLCPTHEKLSYLWRWGSEWLSGFTNNFNFIDDWKQWEFYLKAFMCVFTSIILKYFYFWCTHLQSYKIYNFIFFLS